MATVISAEAYRRLKDKVARYERAREHFDPKRFKRGGGYSVDDQRAIVKAAGLKQAPTNDDREDVAVYEFVRDKPEQLFCYIDGPHRRAKLWSDRSVIGTVELGRDYKTPAFGEASTRVPVKVHAINGCDYAGTYFKSSGDYARLKRVACAAPASAGVGQGGGGARAKQTRLQALEASLPEDWVVRTWSPGDGVTRYRFFHRAPARQTYFGPDTGAYTAIGISEAETFARGLRSG